MALEAFLLALGVVFVAELGDKTQLLILAATLRGRPVPVLLGAVAAFVLLTVLAVSVGGWLGDRLPARVLAVAGGLLFVVLGVLALRERDEDDEAPPRAGGLATTFAVVLVGELGDKTQLATLALATRGHPVATGFGAALALSLTALIAVVAGRWLQAHVRPARLHRVGGWMFIVLGVVAVVLALL